MARRSQGSVPGLRHHKPSGKAVVTLSGQDFYCGTWGTKVALAEYDRCVSEWLARGRRPLTESDGEPEQLTVVELIAAYLRFSQGYYRKNGETTNEFKQIQYAVKVVKQLYGKVPAAEFGPLKLEAVQQAMIRVGWRRKNINKQVGRVVRMFAWGVTKLPARLHYKDDLFRMFTFRSASSP